MRKKLIYDIGMHNGDDSAYYLSLGYRVLSIDASPDLIAKAKIRFNKEVASNDLELLNVGIADKIGKLNFYLNKKNAVWNSFNLDIATRANAEVETVEIPTSTIEQVIIEKGLPYYMKIDIEGNDILCLRSLQHAGLKPRYISAEVNDFSIIEILKEIGYKRFKLIDQFSLLPLELPSNKAYRNFTRYKSFSLSMNPLIRVIRKLFNKQVKNILYKGRSRLLEYDHPLGSSGTFGELLPGKWVTFDEVSHIYNTYLTMHQNSCKDVGYNFWVDIHASNE